MVHSGLYWVRVYWARIELCAKFQAQCGHINGKSVRSQNLFWFMPLWLRKTPVGDDHIKKTITPITLASGQFGCDKNWVSAIVPWGLVIRHYLVTEVRTSFSGTLSPQLRSDEGINYVKIRGNSVLGASMFKCPLARGSKLSISTKRRCDGSTEIWNKMIRGLILQDLCNP